MSAFVFWIKILVRLKLYFAQVETQPIIPIVPSDRYIASQNKLGTEMKKNFKILVIVLIISILSSCSKKTIEVNPHDGVIFLDCRNLIVRNTVMTTNNKIRVSIENTCTTNCLGSSYTGILMIDRNSNDTLAVTQCFTCLVSPKNNTIQDYELDTKLTQLPSLENIRFEMFLLCKDMTFKKK
jgi:hypothetical protein